MLKFIARRLLLTIPLLLGITLISFGVMQLAPGDYLDALRGTVAIGRERRTLKGFLGGVVVPAVRIENWTFTGTT